MKSLLIAGLLWFAVSASALLGQSCSSSVLPEVEVSRPDVFLSDLLAPGSCSHLRQAAARMRLGAAPRAGSLRVLDGDEVNAMLSRLLPAANQSWSAPGAVVPARVVIRRAGVRSACSFVGAAIPETSSPTAASPGSSCAFPMRLSADASLDILRRAWDPALHRWNVFARCTDPAECVLFLLRTTSDAAPPDATRTTRQVTAPGVSVPAQPDFATPLVRPGQGATLVWEAGGIRMTVRAVSLDHGARGEIVRARIVGAERVVRAVVWSGGELRVSSPDGEQ